MAYDRNDHGRCQGTRFDGGDNMVNPPGDVQGYLAGYHLATGHDPSMLIPEC
jgi:hypothetical protein